MAVKVRIVDNYKLELLEDAKCGDIIDLREIESVDFTVIDKYLKQESNKSLSLAFKDKEDKIKLENEKLIEKINNDNLLQINNLNNKIKELENEHKYQIELLTKEFSQEKDNIIESNKNLINELNNKFKLEKNELTSVKTNEIEKLKSLVEKTKLEVTNEYIEQINNFKQSISALNSQIKYLNETKESDIKKVQLELENKYQNDINKLNEEINLNKLNHNNEINNLKSKNDSIIENIKLVNEKNLIEKENQIKEKYNNEIEELKENINLKDKEIADLRFSRSSLSVKLIGEELEQWCNNEVSSLLEVGLFNCNWYKDNVAIKTEGETKGTKGDFILEIYANEEKVENEILTKCLFEMKSEDPNSQNKKKNADHFKKLDQDRLKKNAKYAVLVSTLEADPVNSLPVQTVREYKDMYVVQPQFLTQFISLLNSLSLKFKTLLLDEIKEQKEFEDVIKVEEEFNKIKDTYLNKPLIKLENELTNILKSSENIKKAASDIDNACEEITIKYVNEIRNKIDRFNITKLIKKMK